MRKENNKYLTTPRNDPADRLEVEIGDTKQPDFKPQVKVQRWDNEANVSIRLKDTGAEPETVDEKDGVVTWHKGNKHARFYELSADDQHPEGGFEFEVVLDEKSDTNVVEFTLQDKDVDYFYQPALTEQEIADGAVRPENVVGSYAVYAKTPKTNYVGGKLYKTGKIGHIYRPKIKDANGAEVWGELDIQGGNLTVTIPQEFLDSAVYPVIVDPTFGYQSQGGSTLSVGDWEGSRFTSNGAGNIDSISVFFVNDLLGDAKPAIYDASNNLLTNGVGDETTDISGSYDDWLVLGYTTKPEIADATEYILIAGHETGSVTYDSVGGQEWVADDNTYASGAPDPIVNDNGFSDFRVAIYATYTAGGGAETAAVVPVVTSVTIPVITATYIAVATASVAALLASFAIPAVAATYVQTETAAVSPLTASFSIPAVTAVSEEIFQATVSPLTLTFSIPEVIPTSFQVETATVSPLTLTFTIPSVTAVRPPSSSVLITPSAIPTKSRKVLVIIESRNPTFRYATEDWDFAEITREINGSSMVRFRTDQLTNDIANAITDLGNRVTVRISTDDTASSGLNYFSGYIPTRQLNLTPEDQSVEIVAFGFASRLFDIPFRSGTTVAIDHSSVGIKASDLVEDVIDNAVALDAQLPLTYSAATIDDSVDTIKDKFILQSSAEVLNRAVNLAFDSNVIWHWFVDGDSKFYFKKNSTTADHNFVFGRDITSFPIFSEDMQRAVNEVLVVYNGGANIKRVVDQDSIDSVGLRSMTVNETNIPDVTTATEVGNSYLAQRDLPIRSITVTVSDPYHIESINPGDTCRIDNMDSDISGLLTKNMFITRVSYRRESVDLELSLKHPFLSNQVEQIRRKVEKESVESSAATAYS